MYTQTNNQTLATMLCCSRRTWYWQVDVSISCTSTMWPERWPVSLPRRWRTTSSLGSRLWASTESSTCLPAPAAPPPPTPSTATPPDASYRSKHTAFFSALSNGPIAIAIRARFEYDSSTIRARFSYNTLRGFSCARIRSIRTLHENQW